MTLMMWEQFDNTVIIKRILIKNFTLIITGQMCVVIFTQGIYANSMILDMIYEVFISVVALKMKWCKVVFKIFKYKLGPSPNMHLMFFVVLNEKLEKEAIFSSKYCFERNCTGSSYNIAEKLMYLIIRE